MPHHKKSNEFSRNIDKKFARQQFFRMYMNIFCNGRWPRPVIKLRARGATDVYRTHKFYVRKAAILHSCISMRSSPFEKLDHSLALHTMNEKAVI